MTEQAGLKVLLLNANMSPLTVISAKRAIILMLSQKAESLEDDSEVIWESPSSAIPIPIVIRLVHYVNVPFIKYVGLSKRALYARDNGECQYCGSTKNLTMDHIVPKSRKGTTSWLNVVIACLKCNNFKKNKTLEELGWKLKKEPKAPQGNTWRIKNYHPDPRWSQWLS